MRQFFNILVSMRHHYSMFLQRDKEHKGKKALPISSADISPATCLWVPYSEPFVKAANNVNAANSYAFELYKLLKWCPTLIFAFIIYYDRITFDILPSREQLIKLLPLWGRGVGGDESRSTWKHLSWPLFFLKKSQTQPNKSRTWCNFQRKSRPTKNFKHISPNLTMRNAIEMRDTILVYTKQLRVSVECKCALSLIKLLRMFTNVDSIAIDEKLSNIKLWLKRSSIKVP